jgi:WhiB family redox-sensing transcriptional regulator
VRWGCQRAAANGRAPQGSTGSERRRCTVGDVTDPATAVLTWLISNDESDPFAWLAELTRRPSWHSLAACRGMGADGFVIGRGANANSMARAICSRCPVTVECLDYALANMDTTGIWGGTTAQQRQAMRAARVP